MSRIVLPDYIGACREKVSCVDAEVRRFHWLSISCSFVRDKMRSRETVVGISCGVFLRIFFRPVKVSDIAVDLHWDK